jgi:Protein of unknown function (DUF3431)
MLRRLNDQRAQREGYANLMRNCDYGCPAWVHLDEWRPQPNGSDVRILRQVWPELHPDDV